MNLQITKLGRKLSEVSLKFGSEDICNGIVKSIYDKMGKVIGQYPKVDAVEKTLYYDFKDSDRMKEVKRHFERLIQTYDQKEKIVPNQQIGTINQSHRKR